MIPIAATLITDPVAIFLVVLVIILLAPVVLNRLKLPHIVGMILAGVIVGPHGLNILDRDSSFAIFGQVGLLYLMFLAGLEIDMYHLRLNMKRGIQFGLLTFFIPMIMGVLGSVCILHVNWLTAFLLASMFASHTLISYPVAARFGLTRSPAVLIAVVGTIIAVVGALIVLAGAVNIHQSGSFNISVIMSLCGKLVVYCIAILYLYPRITRQFFKRYNDKVTQYIFVMVMVFLAAWISTAIGLEPVLGAFFAGLVLNRFIPSNSPLMNSIEFVGNALFIPYFLISVGMMINLSVVVHGQTLQVAAIMLVIALVSKWLAAYAAQRLYRMERCDCSMMFGLTTAHTAVALAVVTTGYNMTFPDGSRMMDETILNGTVLVILITCALAPIITSSAAARIKVRTLSDTNANPEPKPSEKNRQVKTLIPVSNPITAASLVELAILMRTKRSGLNADKLFSIHVRNDNSPASIAIGENALRLASEAANGADCTIELIQRFDINTATGIINTIQERDISAIFLGMHHKSTLIDTFLGPKIEQIINSTNRMVVISRCFIPINTITRIVVFVPDKAQYETGFSQWVLAVGNLASELGCRIIFCANLEQQPIIRGIIREATLGLRQEYRDVIDRDDFILLANRVLDDDLFVIIGARPNSVSHATEMAEMPVLLQRHFTRNNICLIFPEQFGAEPKFTFSDPLGSDIVTTASPLWLAFRKRLQDLNQAKKRFTHRNRRR
jgi:Kef-type K+ transport system membrane component KefB